MAENPSAFPRTISKSEWERGYESADGMSLRDWFAGQALAGIACFSGTTSIHVRKAYEYADAMVAERERGK